MRPAKIQIRAVWSETSLGAFWIAKDKIFLYADNEDSDQTTRRLWSDYAEAQGDLSICWARMSEGTFSSAATHVFTYIPWNKRQKDCLW